MPGGGGGGTTNTVSQPWAGQQPYLTKGFQQAEQNVLNRPLSYFPNSTVVSFAPETQMALGAQANRALQGSPLNFAAQQQLGDTLGGQYFTNSPGFQNAVQATMDAVRPSIDSTFAGAGRYGSGLHAQQLGKGFAQGLAPLYESERNRQIQAAGMAPGVANQDYFDIAQLGNVGQQRQGQAGLELQDSINRFNFAQGEPTNRLAQYMNLIQGNYGGQSTSTQRADINPFAALLGTAASVLPFAFL